MPVANFGDDLSAALLYAICIVCYDLGCKQHALDAARSILHHRITGSDSWVAFRAACALQMSPTEMVDFALLNGLEDPSLVENPCLTMLLVGASRSMMPRDWLHRWFDAVEKFALQHGMHGAAAATNYNRGNAALQCAEFAKAVRFYNKARKIEPLYLSTDYFLQEFGGALYEARHYASANCLYSKAITKKSSSIEWHRLGDAQLLSGDITSAIKSFDRAVDARKPSPEMFSSMIKHSLCHWLLEAYMEPLPVRRHDASIMLKRIIAKDAVNESGYRRVLREACALDLVSNFNVGVSCESRGQFVDALYHFLLCGIQCPNDVEAWSNAMICGWNIGSEEFFIVLSAAYAHSALEGYSAFRTHIAEQGAPIDAIDTLDSLVVELDDPTTVSKNFSDC